MRIRECSRERDFIQWKAQVKQKRLLSNPMLNSQKTFLTTVQYGVILTTFCLFKAFWVTRANVKDRNTGKCSTKGYGTASK